MHKVILEGAKLKYVWFPFKATLFPEGCELFQQDNEPCYEPKTLPEHDECEVWIQTNQASVGCAGQTRPRQRPQLNSQDLKDLLLTRRCHIRKQTFRRTEGSRSGAILGLLCYA